MWILQVSQTSCTVAAKKGNHKGEAGGQTPVGKQWGTEEDAGCTLGWKWGCPVGNSNTLSSQTLFICLHSGQSFLLPRRLSSHFRGLWSQNAWSIPCHQPQEDSHKHHFNPNVSFFTTTFFKGWMNMPATQPLPTNLLQGMLPLAKVLLSTPPALHTFPAHVSPTQQQWAALGVAYHAAQWAQPLCFLAASTA